MPLLKNLRQDEHYTDISFQDVCRNYRNMEGVGVLYLSRTILVLSIDKQKIPIDLIEANTREQTVKRLRAHNERHTGLDCLVLDVG
jgi:hypothetical protein